MPGVDTECKGRGATHHHACKCREARFRNIEQALKVARQALTHVTDGFVMARQAERAIAEIDRLAGEAAE